MIGPVRDRSIKASPGRDMCGTGREGRSISPTATHGAAMIFREGPVGSTGVATAPHPSVTTGTACTNDILP